MWAAAPADFFRTSQAGACRRAGSFSPDMVEVAAREHPGSAREMEDRFAAAGFALVFEGSTPPEDGGPRYGYMLVRKAGGGSG